MAITTDTNGNTYIADFVKISEKYYQKYLDDSQPDNDLVVYVRYYNTDPSAIQRQTIIGNLITCEWAVGNWADRVTLDYKPINETIS